MTKWLLRGTSVVFLFVVLIRGIKMIYDATGIIYGSVLLFFFGVVINVEYNWHGIEGIIATVLAIVGVTSILYVFGYFNESEVKGKKRVTNDDNV